MTTTEPSKETVEETVDSVQSSAGTAKEPALDHKETNEDDEEQKTKKGKNKKETSSPKSKKQSSLTSFFKK